MKTTLTCDEQDVRLDRFIRRHHPFITQIQVEKALRKNQIKVNGKKAQSSSRLVSDDVVDLYMDLNALKDHYDASAKPKYKHMESLTPEQRTWIESMILWDDKDICVLNKPSGIAVQGGSKTTEHLDHMMNLFNPKETYKLVHRLDKDTSGVLVFAKTQSMATYLAESFRDGTVEKKYWAIVLGDVEHQKGTIKVNMTKDLDGDKEKMMVAARGKPSITQFRTVRKAPDITWVELKPKTGRTHQLRVHMDYIGAPIIGDLKYGGRGACLKSKKLHLHARQISLPIGMDGKFMTFTAPLTGHMLETFEKYHFQWEHLA